jgi:hypothetical protein
MEGHGSGPCSEHMCMSFGYFFVSLCIPSYIMQFLPMALTGAAAIPSLIGGIMSAITAGKNLTGGRLRRRQHKRKGRGLVRRRGGKHVKYHRKKGKGLANARMKRIYKMKGSGVVADTLGSIPLLGMLLGPMAKAFGGRLKHKRKRVHKKRGGRVRGGLNRRKVIMALVKRLRGRGLSPMYIRRPYVSSGCGLSPMYIRRPYVSSGCGLSPMYIRRPYVSSGAGLLAPIGAKMAHSYLTPSLAAYKFPPSPKYTPPPMSLIPYVPMPSHNVGSLGTTPASVGMIDSYARGMQSGQGLLRPAGGYMRKGHLRKIKGKAHRVRVKPAVVGHGLLSPAGGYVPYHGYYRRLP